MKRKYCLFAILFVLFAIFIIVKIFFHKNEVEISTSQFDPASDFIYAIQNGNSELAIQSANKLIDTQSISLHQATKYSLFFKNSGINPAYLTDKFNQLDYIFWRRRFLFHDLAHRIIKNDMTDEQKIICLYEAVTTHIGKAENLKDLKGFWPEQIWHNRNGLCDRQSWVLFELLRSVGFKPVMVLLYNSKNISHHTLLTVFANKKSYILDPFCKVKKAKMTIEQLLDPSMKKDPFVMEYTKLMPDTKSASYSLFFSPQEYVMRNILLADILRKKRLNFYLTEDMGTLVDSLLRDTNIPAEKFNLSTYPFILLYDDLKNNRFPNQNILSFQKSSSVTPSSMR